jgi:hypothetical protein
MEQKKKLTNAQLQRRIQNALVFVPKDKDYIGIWFEDKGLRLEATGEYCVISTGYHRHVFTSFTNSGISRPYLYTKRVIEIANENDCKTEDGYSFAKLLKVLYEKDDRSEYNICVYFEWYVYNCFQPLYSIGESEAESFLVYESYVHNIARNSIILSEKLEDITNKDFVEKVIENMKSFTDGVEERVVFPKKSDEELVREEIGAINEQEMNDGDGDGE